MDNATRRALKIDPKFPKLGNGDECDGREIVDAATGERLGRIFRVIDWKHCPGMSERYTAKVVAYALENYGDEDAQPVEYTTLAEATRAARVLFGA